MTKWWLIALVGALGTPAYAQQAGEQKVAFERKALPCEGEVTAERLNVRMFPKNDQASIIASVLGIGDKVTIVAERDDFFQILPPRGCTAWIFGKSVRKDGAAGTVVANDVPVRLDSRVNADTVATLKEGEAVKIVGEHMGWYKIEAPASVKYFVAKKYVKAGRTLENLAVPDGLKAEPRRAAAPGDVRARIQRAEAILDEQRRLIDALKLDAVDFSGVVREYEEALGMAPTAALKAEIEALYKRYTNLHAVWTETKRKLADEEAKLRAERDKAAQAKAEPEKKWVMAGYVDTTGSTLFKRPGTHKLVMGGKIVCFLRIRDGDEKMIDRLNNHYEKYVGVTGVVIKNPDGWDGYSVVVVEDIVPIIKD